MSEVYIDGDRASFSYDMKTRDCGWSKHIEPIRVIGCHDVIEIAPEPDREFRAKVNMVLFLRKLEVI